MALEPVWRAGFIMVGESVVTTHTDEMRPEAARIPRLWRRFFSLRGGASKGVPTAIFDRYESDHRGAFRVTLADDTPESGTPVVVPDGLYVQFVAEGRRPAAVARTWQEIWDLTEAGGLRRAFTADYELHVSPTRAEIYVAVVASSR
ncbi:MAG TPA: GyrI-like domain-containing protein [Haliangiales bacterium]|nr:GyrI-like domain-containing protein [Haliangiales bacterium]